MSECQFCRSLSSKTITILASRRLMSQKEPPNIARFSLEPPAFIEELDLYEVGSCCERDVRAELSRLRGVLLTLATAPDTMASWLLALWSMYQHKADFRAALMQNPNLPSLLAKLLGPLCFDELLENPTLPLWCLESPLFLQELEESFLQRMETLKEARWSFTCAASWVRHLSISTNPKARCYVASHCDTPAEIRQTLAADPSPEVRRYLAYHADEELLLRLAADEDLDVRRHAARVGLHYSVLAILARDPAHEVRISVGRNMRVQIPRKMRAELREEVNT
jgi:hypothetical protein